MTPSASATERLFHCQWPFRPEVEAPPEEPKPDMLRGSGVHAAIESHLLSITGRPILDAAAPFYASWARWWATAPFGTEGTYHVEKAPSYDTATDTARWTGVEGRNYGREPGTIAGRPDLVIVQATRVIVADWKSGEDWAGYASENAPAQLRTYALAAARIAGVDEAVIVPCQITPGEVIASPTTLDIVDLDAHAEKLKLALSDVERAIPVSGGHCLRCPAISICPKHDTTALETARVLPVITIDNAGPLYLDVRAWEARLAQVKRACEAQILAAGKVPMPDGGTLEIATSDVEKIRLDGPQGAEAEAILIRAGAGATIERPPPKAGKTEITKLLGAKNARPVLDELRALGALAVSHQTHRVVVTQADGPLVPVRAKKVPRPAPLPSILSDAEAVAMLAPVASVVEPVEVPAASPIDALMAFVAETKAAQTLDDVRALRARFQSMEWPGSTHTTAMLALEKADNRVSR